MSHLVFNMFVRKWECSIDILCILIDVKLISDIQDTIIDITDTSYDNFYDIDKNNLWRYFKISIFSPKNDQIHEISINCSPSSDRSCAQTLQFAVAYVY